MAAAQTSQKYIVWTFSLFVLSHMIVDLCSFLTNTTLANVKVLLPLGPVPDACGLGTRRGYALSAQERFGSGRAHSQVEPSMQLRPSRGLLAIRVSMFDVRVPVSHYPRRVYAQPKVRSSSIPVRCELVHGLVLFGRVPV